MSEIGLRPCPFCGGNAQLSEFGWPHSVYCIECGAKVASTLCFEKGKADATKKWNQRVYERNIKYGNIDADY